LKASPLFTLLVHISRIEVNASLKDTAVDQTTIDALNAINKQFYETTAQEFDQTRGRAWNGWIKLKPHLNAPLSVLDVGCGNGRFALFLANELDGQITYHGIDNNAALLQSAETSFKGVDSLSATVDEHDIVQHPPTTGTYDLVVLFGVIHHIPGWENRKRFMVQLAERVNDGGLLCFAAWRFYEYERFTKRLTYWDEAMSVERHDYLLDWRRGERALRYCHYVDDTEHNALVTATGLTELSRYRADGSDDRMNMYSVLQKS